MTNPLLPVTAPVETPVSAREALVDRFLARLAALSPRQWGELDAIGQRLHASDPITLWATARRLSAFTSKAPAFEDVSTVITFVSMGLGRLANLGRRRPSRPERPYYATPHARSYPDSETRAFAQRMDTLTDIQHHQPGGPGDAGACLWVAMSALWQRDHLTPEGFARLYAPVEPVIPFASL